MTPSSSRAPVSTISRTDAMPERWPSTRGRLRARAQRPFPSMITATCRGRRLKSIFSRSVSSMDPGSASLLKSIIESPMLVRNVPKHQTFCRRSPPRFLERRLECARDCHRLEFPTSDLDERPRNPAHNVAQKTVCAHANANYGPVAGDVYGFDRSACRRHLRRDDGERSEVVFANETARGVAHDVFIQFLSDVRMGLVCKDIRD